MPRQYKITVNKDGYPVIDGAGARRIRKDGTPDRNPLVLHRWITLDTLGIHSYPGRVYHIHHCDGNKLNWDFDNLVLLTADSHRLVHSIGKAEGRWLPKSEILSDARFDTNYREFEVVWGAPETAFE